MRLGSQLMLLMVAVGTVPVAVSGVSGARLVARELDDTAHARLAADANALAEGADALVRQALADVRLTVAAVDWLHLTAEERQGALNLLYRQAPVLTAAALVDARGEGVGSPVFTPVGAISDERLRGRAQLDGAAVGVFADHVPLQAALRVGAAVGSPYTSRGEMRLAAAVAVDLGPDVRGAVAVEVDLSPLLVRLEATARGLRGAAACIIPGGPQELHVSTLGQPLGEEHAAPLPSADMQLRVGDTPVWVARAPLEGLPWVAVVAQPVEVARAASTRLAEQAVLWALVALVCAVLTGIILARAVTRPLKELTAGAQAFAAGTWREPIAADGATEVRALTAAFNAMAGHVRDRDEALRAFNAELQQRVEQRTRELREAQDQILQAQKLAAVGELGAGVAHEINNPLAGILGSAQLMMLKTEDEQLRSRLADIEKEALRIRDIVQNLLALSPQKDAAESLVDLNRVVEASLGLMARGIVENRIEVRRDLDAGLPRVRGRAADVQQAVLALLANARQVMPDGGVLTVRTAGIDGKLVRLSVLDTGPGVPVDLRERIFEPFFTTRAAHRQKGLGLALAHRVVTDMGGKLWVEGAPGGGAAFEVSLAASRDRTHLA